MQNVLLTRFRGPGSVISGYRSMLTEDHSFLVLAERGILENVEHLTNAGSVSS